MEETKHEYKPDWEIGDLYKKAWEIVKKNKVLWIFGFLAAGSGGSNFNIPNFSDSSTNTDAPQQTQQILENLPTPTPSPDMVLGQATTAVGDMIGQLFAHIPVWIYIILGIELFLFILVCIAMSIVYRQWTIGSLLAGIQLAIDKKRVSIQESSEIALSRFPSLLWLGFIPSLIIGLITIPLVGIPVAGLIAGPTAIKIVCGLLLFLVILALIVLSTLLGLAQIWAPRKVIHEQTSGLAALKAGLSIARKKFWAMFLLGLVNTFLGAFVIGVPVVVMLLIIFGGAIGISMNKDLIIGALIVGIPLIILLIGAMAFISGVFTAFKATVWSIAYNNIKGKYDGK